jgi:hypothetical protein
VELESLENAQAANSASWLNAQGFTSVQSSYYWSASTQALSTNAAWILDMQGGGVTNNVKAGSNHVWPVRGGKDGPAQTWRTGQTTSYADGDDGALEIGVDWPVPRFTDNGNGTVTDYLTGLIWLKNADCFGQRTWSQALSDCNNLDSGSCGLTDGSAAGDWRLPNRKELFSLIDYSRHGPALSQGHPFSNVQSSFYWSDSTFAYITTNAWVVYMNNGYHSYSYKSFSDYVWPVRGGQSGSPGDLTILYPNGGATLTKGQGHTITWTSTAVTGAVAIDLYKGGTTSGFFVMQVAAVAPNTGSHPFNPPVFLADGSDYMIRISAENGAVSDFSDGFFTIIDDVNGDGRIGLEEVIRILQIISGSM